MSKGQKVQTPTGQSGAISSTAPVASSNGVCVLMEAEAAATKKAADKAAAEKAAAVEAALGAQKAKADAAAMQKAAEEKARAEKDVARQKDECRSKRWKQRLQKMPPARQQFLQPLLHQPCASDCIFWRATTFSALTRLQQIMPLL